MAKSWKDEMRFPILRGEVDEVRRLIAAGAPVSGDSIDGQTPLYYAVEHKQLKVVRALIEAGADVDERCPAHGSRTAQMLAAYRGQLAIVEALLAAGADATLLSEYGIGLLGEACCAGKGGNCLKIVQMLLRAGARLEPYALTAAAQQGSPEMIRALVEAGADVNEVSRWCTALHLAVAEKRADNVEALLALGADPNLRLPADVKPYGGKTALELAREYRLKKIVTLLESPPAAPPPAAPPPGAADVLALWKRLQAALKKSDPDLLASLNGKATKTKIDAAEKRLGVALPDDVKASFLVCNGQKDDAEGLFPEELFGENYLLLSLDGVVAEWRPWRDLHDMDEFAGRVSSPDDGVRDDWWHPAWVPVASNGGGDALCLDLAPAPAGAVGQVIGMSHEDGQRPRVAASFADLLRRLAEHYEAGL